MSWTQHEHTPTIMVPFTKTSIPTNSGTSLDSGQDYLLLPMLAHPRGDQVSFRAYMQSSLGTDKSFVSSCAPIA